MEHTPDQIGEAAAFLMARLSRLIAKGGIMTLGEQVKMHRATPDYPANPAIRAMAQKVAGILQALDDRDQGPGLKLIQGGLSDDEEEPPDPEPDHQP